MSERRTITFYDAQTGIITRTQRIVAGQDPVITREGEAWLWGRHDPSLFRIDVVTGEAVELAAPEVSIDGNRLSGVPAGARVSLGGMAFDATGEPIEIIAVAAETVAGWARCPARSFREFTIAVDPAANRPDAPGAQVVDLEQDPVRMRLREYPSDGDQLDAIAKALAEVLDANPELTGPGVQELRGIIEQRQTVKAMLPKGAT